MTVRSDTKKTISRWWYGPLASIVSLLVMFAILEIGIRVYLDDEVQTMMPHFGVSEDVQWRAGWDYWRENRERFGSTSYPSPFDEIDAELGWRVKPSVQVRHGRGDLYEVGISTNQFALRGRYPESMGKPEGHTRIGFFGCSQTFGETVNDSETYIYHLNENHPGEYLNFGVRGYGTDQMLLDYRARGGDFDLDVVVLAFAFYHLERNRGGFMFFAKPYFELSEQDELLLRGVPVPTPEELIEKPIDDQLWTWLDHSVLARWVWGKVRNLNVRAIYSADGEVWRKTEKMIEQFVTEVRDSGARPVLMNIDESHPELEPLLGTLANRLDADLIDLAPVLRDARERGVDYNLHGDNHWTATGNELVATTIGEYFCEHEVIDCGS